jgi:hypothetical protein
MTHITPGKKRIIANLRSGDGLKAFIKNNKSSTATSGSRLRREHCHGAHFKTLLHVRHAADGRGAASFNSFAQGFGLSIA